MHALEVPPGEWAGRSPEIESTLLAIRASIELNDIAALIRPASIGWAYRLNLAGPVRQYDVKLLPVVGATLCSSRTSAAKPLSISLERVNAAADAVQAAAATRERQRERNVPGIVWDLKCELTKADSNNTVREDAAVNRQLRRDGVRQTIAALRAFGPGHKIFLYLLSDRTDRYVRQVDRAVRA
jgi:hypothetical protein